MGGPRSALLATVLMLCGFAVGTTAGMLAHFAVYEGAEGNWRNAAGLWVLYSCPGLFIAGIACVLRKSPSALAVLVLGVVLVGSIETYGCRFALDFAVRVTEARRAGRHGPMNCALAFEFIVLFWEGVSMFVSVGLAILVREDEP